MFSAAKARESWGQLPEPEMRSKGLLGHSPTRATLGEQGSFLLEHARPLNKRCAWRLTTGFAFIKMARLKDIIAIILLVGLGECARDLTKCVVSKKKTLTWS